MNKIITNTLIYLAFVSSLVLILNKELELFITILSIGLIVSYISKDMLVILGSAFAFVYLNEYNNTKENMGPGTAFVASTLAGIGGGVGGYFIARQVDPTFQPPPQDTNLVTDTWYDKIRDKTFPGLFGSETGEVLARLQKRQKTAILDLIGIGKPSVIGEVQQDVQCPDGEYLLPQYAYKTGRYTCKAGLSEKTCCGPLAPGIESGADWVKYINDPDGASSELRSKIPCWAQKGDTVKQVDGGCNQCPTDKPLQKTGKTMECVDVTNVFSNGEYNFGDISQSTIDSGCCMADPNDSTGDTSTESFTQRGGNALIMNTELTPNANHGDRNLYTDVKKYIQYIYDTLYNTVSVNNFV